MQKLVQTILHDPPNKNGNCFPTVIACITDIRIENVLPVNDMFAIDYWHYHLFFWLYVRGWLWRQAPEFESLHKKIDIEAPEEMTKDKYYLVTGMTKRFDGKAAHVCIYLNGELFWDPHPDQSGLTTEDHFEVIEKIITVFPD